MDNLKVLLLSVINYPLSINIYINGENAKCHSFFSQNFVKTFEKGEFDTNFTNDTNFFMLKLIRAIREIRVKPYTFACHFLKNNI